MISVQRLKKIFNYYGPKNQLMKCAEECAEFQTELLKSLNGKSNRDDLLTEMADLFITVEYVKMAYDISDAELGYEIERKLVRQENRIDGCV